MKAIEKKGTIGKDGMIHISTSKEFAGKEIKIIILIPESDYISDNEWLIVNTNNPAFNFLNDPGEDIYTINDGKTIEHEK